jgi:hypothetical protein
MTTLTNEEKTTQLQQLISGIQKNSPNIVLALASQTYTAPQLVTLLESLLTAASLVVTSKTSWKDAVTANAKLEAQYAPLVTELKLIIQAMYSNATTTLADFGLKPKKSRTPLTTEQRAARAAKAAATRKARGTTSKKQKAAITGDVTGVNIVPVTGSGSSAAGTAPTAGGASAPAAAPVTPAATTSGTAAAPVTPAAGGAPAANGAAGTGVAAATPVPKS